MAPEPDYASVSSDIIIKGNLRKAKTWNKRYFVLREGSPPKLEYYENERKWKVNKPKRCIDLGRPWNISKKKDSKHEFLIVIFTEDDYFTMAADNIETQQQWVDALTKAVKPDPGSLLFKHVWHVTLDNKELELSNSNLLMQLHGPHRICLTHDCVVFVHANNSGGWDMSRGDPIEIQISRIRVCGHKENLFFIEPGRASGLGNGKLWMDLGDEQMAHQMHQTIRLMMDVSYYRGRSYSSGSNPGRVRSVRSHHNNPPPKQIGMGKVPGGSSSKRIRCDSLPGAHIGSQDPRLRTGSEGEHTMKRPSRFNSIRSPGGSVSPGMRRFWSTHTKRSDPHHLICHPHTSSFSSSYQSSSEASSTEQLNASIASNSEPSSGYLTMVNGPIRNLHSESTSSHDDRSVTPDLARSTCSTPPIHEDLTGGNNYCPNCFIHLQRGFYDAFNQRTFASLEHAPPPPNEQPPPNPFGVATSANLHEYVNLPVHSRTQSLDDSLSYSTAASSLSASPQQQAAFHHMADQQPIIPVVSSRTINYLSHSPSQSTLSDHGSCSYTSPLMSTSRESTLLSNEPYSQDDYTVMDFENQNKYPHQSPSYLKHPTPRSFTIIAKLVSSNNNVSSPRVTSSPGQVSSDYTPMAIGSTLFQAVSENTSSSKSSQACSCYVPMRGFSPKSLPQEICNRRRSVPANLAGNGAALNGNSCIYGHSPDKCYTISAPCSFCGESDPIPPSKLAAGDTSDLAPCKFHLASPHYNCQLKLADNCTGNDMAISCGCASSAETQMITPSNGTSRLSTPSPSNGNSQDYLNMRPLNIELHDVCDNGVKANRTKLLSSTPPDNEPDVKKMEINGYLPMSGLYGGHARKSLTNSALPLSADCASSHPRHIYQLQYPHQRKEAIQGRNLSTNSLDRSKRSHKSKRPTSLGFRHTMSSVGSTRRSQSLRHSKKTASAGSVQNIPPSTKPETPTSPGGEYVNIDYAKAQQQSGSPHVISVTSSKEKPPSCRVPSFHNVPALDISSDYSSMSLNGVAH